MDSVLNNTTAFLSSQSLQIAIVFLLVLLTCQLVRSCSAHWRYWLWLVVIVKCLTPPMIVLPLAVLPHHKLPNVVQTAPLQTDGPTSSTTPADWPSIQPPEMELGAQNSAGVVSAIGQVRTTALRSWTWSQVLTMTWLVGATLILSTVIVRMLATQIKIGHARVLADQAVQSAVATLSQRVGLKSPPKVYQLFFASQPFVWGWLRGAIYLPEHFTEADAEDKRQTMLAHELAHVARWDAGVNLVQNLVQALFFFHPLVWIANRRLRFEREKCCDEIVLSTLSTSPKVYCEAIVDMLARQPASKTSMPALAVTGSRSGIQERILTMLTPNRQFLRRPSRWTIMVITAFAMCVLPTMLIITARRGLTQSPPSSKTQFELKTFKLKIVDESDRPIPHAKVSGRGMRFKEDPSSGYGWATDSVSSEFEANDEGEVSIDYPVRMGQPGQPLTTQNLILHFQHPDYVAEDGEFFPELEDQSQRLKSGCPIAFRCQDSQGNKINDFQVLMSGKGGEAVWKVEDGRAYSNGIPEGTWQTMLFAPSDEGLRQFSLPFNAECKPGSRNISDIVVKPGMQVAGKLSANVPRPVSNGKVIAWCVPHPLGPSLIEAPAVTWLEETTINADGTFQFPALPPSQSIQLIALASGWIGQGWEGGSMRGLQLTLDDKQLAENQLLDVDIPMEAAGKLQVEVVDPEGKPLAGAAVNSWPNQAYSHGGTTTLLGLCYGTTEQFKVQNGGEPVTLAELYKQKRYDDETDANGIAQLEDIPVNQTLFLEVYSSGLRMKANKQLSDVLSVIEYKLDTPGVKKIKVQMERPETAPGEHDKIKAPAATRVASDVPSQPAVATDVIRFEVELLGDQEFLKSCRERDVTVPAALRTAILDYIDGLEMVSPEIQPSVDSLRDGKSTLSLHALMIILGGEYDRVSLLTKKLSDHSDPVVRFAANLTRMTNKDFEAAEATYDLVHDTSLPRIDRQLICTWCSGVGIRPTDTAPEIREHFSNVTRETPKFMPGDLAPEFEAVTTEGQKLNSRDLRGKVIVLHFWATSCGPCLGQMPQHIDTLSKYDPKKLEVVFVSLDDDAEKFQGAVAKYRMPFKHVRDPRGWGGDLTRAFGVSSMPLDIIIDGQGKIVSNSIEDLGRLVRKR